MKELSIKQFNDCKTRPDFKKYQAISLRSVAVIGTSKRSLKEIYMVSVRQNNRLIVIMDYFVQRFVKDAENENMIILNVKYNYPNLN